jgi:response regulator RpfG family c-di-GMP phosphodiesterase
MENYRILLSGPTISHNEILIESLSTYASVIENENYNLIESQIENYHIDLLVLEITNHENFEIKLIDRIKTHFPNIKIIIINGKKDQRFLAKVLASGANDVYRQPCNVPLLVEKVHAFLFLQDKLKV